MTILLKDLRADSSTSDSDSPALDFALKLKPEVLYPVWTWE